jgi:uncharacterized membrane-anchored protein
VLADKLAAMTTIAQPATATSRGRQMLNKVPEVTLYFWIIKILCTTVGETFADYLNDTLGMGLTNTTYIMGTLLLIVLFFQFRARKYVPSIYWLAVVLISVVGTLITDNLVENFGVALQTTTIAFSIALAVTFAAWYASERTLSIHTIFTTRREIFYWVPSANVNMSQAKADGGLALGTTVTSLIFLATILALVIYLQLTRKDATENAARREAAAAQRGPALEQG